MVSLLHIDLVENIIICIFKHRRNGKARPLWKRGTRCIKKTNRNKNYKMHLYFRIGFFLLKIYSLIVVFLVKHYCISNQSTRKLYISKTIDENILITWYINCWMGECMWLTPSLSIHVLRRLKLTAQFKCLPYI